MKPLPAEPQLYDCLSTLEPDVMAALEKEYVYARFMRERETLSALCAQTLAQTGTLNTPAVLAQVTVVAALGQLVLETIARIRDALYLQDEPAHIGAEQE